MNVLSRREEPDIIVFEFEGRIVLGRDSHGIEEMVDEALARNDRKLVFDLTEVDYLDSAGLGIIVACVGKARKRDGDLLVAELRSRLHELVKITGLDRVLGLYPTAAEACRAFGSDSLK